MQFDHSQDFYADSYIREILQARPVIALVGASANWNRPSFFAMKYLLAKGYHVIPVNPGQAGKEILGQKVYESLSAIPEPFDMVDIFRISEAAQKITEDAISLGAKYIWMQLGVVNHDAANLAEEAGLKVVMNRCPKIEYARLSGELGWNGINSRVISAKKRVF